MAYPIELTIGTGNKVTLNYQSKEVSVSLTYRLERGDEDVLAIAREKSVELVAVHQATWERVRAAPQSQSLSTPPKSNSQPKESDPHSIPREENATASLNETVTESAIESVSEAAKTERRGLQGVEDKESSVPAEVHPTVGHSTADYSTVGQHLALRALLTQSGLDEHQIEEVLSDRFECDSLEALSYEQATGWLLELQRTERERVRSHRTSSQSKDSNSASSSASD